MGKARAGWWAYAKHMIRRYPDADSENEREAVRLAIEETLRRRNGCDRMAVVRMVLMEGTHNLAGAALQVPCSEHTARMYHMEFIRTVGRNFKCDGLK